MILSNDLDVLKKSLNNIILFGEVGSGKTTLINQLCQKNFETREGGYSCTTNIQYAKTSDENIIIDFPGLNATENITQHLKIQKSILSQIPVKMICLVIKANTRIDNIWKSTLRMMKIFYENRSNIAIILTFSEELTDNQKKLIKSYLNKKSKIDENLMMFSGNNTDFSELNNTINLIKNRFLNITSLNFKEKNLLNSDLNEETLEFKDDKIKECIKVKYNIQKQLEIRNDEIKLALYFTFKFYLEDLIRCFREKLEKLLLNNDTINCQIIVFKNELNEHLEFISEKFNFQKDSPYFKKYENAEYEKCMKDIYKGFNNPNKDRKIFISGKFDFCHITINLINFDIIIEEYNKIYNIDSNNKIINRDIDNNNINTIKYNNINNNKYKIPIVYQAKQFQKGNKRGGNLLSVECKPKNNNLYSFNKNY